MRIIGRSALVLSGAGLFLACTNGSSTPIETVAPDGARIVHSETGALTLPAAAPADVIVRDFLRVRGAGVAVDGLRVTRASAPQSGVSHLRMEQTVDGRRVIGAYVKAALSERGELLHLIDKVVPLRGAIAAASVDEQAALRSALQHLGYEIRTPAQLERKGNLTRFVSDKVFHRAPTVERVVFVDELGTTRSGFLVETWSQRENQLDETLVAGDGRIVSVERRTNNDSYNVFTEDPDKGGQTVVVGPGTWLGNGTTQYATNISGPNALAYLDTDANNAPDASSVPVSTGDFLAVADLAAQPSTSGNRAVAVQNLFYLNNVLHDVLAAQGFDVAAGNFQGNDPVKAEAQDGSGTDNANFSTPNDGSSPRMQMFLWSGSDPEALVTLVAGGSFGAYGSGFGPALTLAGVSGALASYADGTAPAGDACQASTGSLTGKVALIDRGTCDFTLKVLNAQKAGAIGVIVINNVTGRAFAMGGTERRIKIPSGMVTLEDGAILRAAGGSAKLAKNPVAPLMVDGDLDSDIVYHEYGHGLTWRMIGSMSGPFAGAIGEGASDVLAFTLNGDDIIGEYSYSDANGIRRAPYDTYLADTGNTYIDVTGAEVHDDGEIYAAAMWRVRTLYLNAGLSSDDLLYDFVQGMNYTPSAPAFENMRDGMLQALATRTPAPEPTRACLIWNGFAKYGIGVGAQGTVSRRGKVQVTESFAVPNTCPNLN